jgi:hypothetical protein
VPERAEGGIREGEIGRARAHQRDKAGKVIGADAGMADQDKRPLRDARDRGEVGKGVIARVAHHLARDDMGVGVEHQRPSVGRCRGDRPGADHAIAAGAVLDHPGLAQQGGQGLGVEAADGVDRPAWREGHDQPDIGALRAGGERKRKSGAHQGAAADLRHGFPPAGTCPHAGRGYVRRQPRRRATCPTRPKRCCAIS